MTTAHVAAVATFKHRAVALNVPLDRYFQSPPSRRVEISDNFKWCPPMDQRLRTCTAKQAGITTN